MTYINGTTRRAVLLGLGVGVGIGSVASAVEAQKFGITGDGLVDDGPAIQRALLSGEHIRLPAGIYRLDDSVLAPPSGCRISGEPGRTILAKRTGGSASYTKPFFDISDVHDITIEGITFEETVASAREFGFHIRASAPQKAQRILIRKCIFKNTPNFVERNVRTVWIDDNRFLGGGPRGAMVGVAIGGWIDKARHVGVNEGGLVQDIYIRRNYFENIRDEGVDVNWDVWNVEIENNTFVDCDASNQKNEAIDIGGGDCNNIIVRNNRIVFTRPETESRGIWVKLNSRNVLIENNTVTNASGQGIGILISHGGQAEIRDNYVDGFAVPVKR
jgi:parallel beta-helix repeat protein